MQYGYRKLGTHARVCRGAFSQTTEKGKKRGVSMERSKVGMKEKVRSPNGLSLPTQNRIIINIIV